MVKLEVLLKAVSLFLVYSVQISLQQKKRSIYIYGVILHKKR